MLGGPPEPRNRIAYPEPIPRHCPICNARLTGIFPVRARYTCYAIWKWEHPAWVWVPGPDCRRARAELAKHTEAA